jgi:RNA polymerase sigma-70 factor (ECF subfamily)
MDADALWAQGVIEQNRRWLLAYVYTVVGDAAAAEDIVQDVFSIAYAKRAEFRTGLPFGAWLRGIARNVALRHLERRARAPLLAGDDTALWDALDRRAAALEQAHLVPGFEADRLDALRACLETLADKARRLLVGRYREGLSFPALGRLCGLTTASVPVVLHRARMTLGECIRRKTAP